jgi:hypothetical protein
VPKHLRLEEAPAWVAARLQDRTGTRWVGVDGFGAAGKSTLARRIAAALPGARIVAVDDFGRAGVRGWDRALFTSAVLDPLRRGHPGRYQHWDLNADVGRDWVEVPPGVPVVVEGVSATDDRVPVPWDVTLWLEVPAAERSRRIARRDPDPARQERWRTDWWPSEQAYAAAQQPWTRVDAVITVNDPAR